LKTIARNYLYCPSDSKLRYFGDIFDDLDRAQKIVGHVFHGFPKKYKTMKNVCTQTHTLLEEIGKLLDHFMIFFVFF
jgi:hypothetical protein